MLRTQLLHSHESPAKRGIFMHKNSKKKSRDFFFATECVNTVVTPPCGSVTTAVVTPISAKCYHISFVGTPVFRLNVQTQTLARHDLTERAPRQSLPREMGVHGSAERLDRGCVSERQNGRLCGLQRPKFARRGCAADEPCCAWRRRLKRWAAA